MATPKAACYRTPVRNTPDSTDQLVADAQAMLRKHPATHHAAPQTHELISQSEFLLKRQRRERLRARMLAAAAAAVVLLAGGTAAALFLR